MRYTYVWVVEADIKSFFDSINHDLLVAMLRTRINDEAFIRLIQKWLRAGVLHADGAVEQRGSGTPQGGIISPVPANIYLHFALDRWFEKDVKRQSDGEGLMVRYADDFVAAFRFHRDASRFLRTLRRRMEKFSLALAEEKTRKLQFNRFKKAQSSTFSFLGFTFRRIVTRRGFDTVRDSEARDGRRTLPKAARRVPAGMAGMNTARRDLWRGCRVTGTPTLTLKFLGRRTAEQCSASVGGLAADN